VPRFVQLVSEQCGGSFSHAQVTSMLLGICRAIADKYDIGHLCGLYPDAAQCVLLHDALPVADMRTSAPMPAAQSLADPQSANRTNAAL